MKKTLAIIWAIALGMFAFSACEEKGGDDTPANKEFTAVAASEISSEAQTGYILLHVTLKDAAGVAAVLDFGNDTWLLKAGQYSLQSPVAAAGKYAGTLDGKAITRGMLTVAGDVNKYTISGIVETDATRWTVKFEGPIAFEDKAPVMAQMTEVFVQQVNDGSVTIKVGTSGIAYDAATSAFDGNGNVWGMDIYSADGYLHEGTYKPCAKGGEIGEGEYGIGWDPGDLWGIGMVFENWGTVYFTYKNGVNTDATKINEGNIVVTKDGDNWTIVYGESGDDLWVGFTGALPMLTMGELTPEPSADKLIELTTLYCQDNNANEQYPQKSYTFYGVSDGVQYANGWAGSGYVFQFTLYADGGLTEGEFTPNASAGAPLEAGQFAIGYEGDYMGFKYTDGSYITTLTNSRGVVTLIADGKITVDQSGNDITIELVASNAHVKYTGAIPEGCSFLK